MLKFACHTTVGVQLMERVVQVVILATHIVDCLLAIEAAVVPQILTVDDCILLQHSDQYPYIYYNFFTMCLVILRMVPFPMCHMLEWKRT